MGHPVVGSTNGQITSGSRMTATDLVLQTGALGDLHTLKAGNTSMSSV